MDFTAAILKLAIMINYSTNQAFNPPADGLDMTMRGTLNVMFDYCSIPLCTYLKLGAQAGFLSNFEKSPYLCFWHSRLG